MTTWLPEDEHVPVPRWPVPDGARTPVPWPQAVRDAWADDPDRTTRRETYR